MMRLPCWSMLSEGKLEFAEGMASAIYSGWQKSRA
jgi:hypothetical protein